MAFYGFNLRETQHVLILPCASVTSPPSNSSRGALSVEFFDHLKSNVHEFQNIDAFWICGDFNARCGRLTDTIDSNNKSIPA